MDTKQILDTCLSWLKSLKKPTTEEVDGVAMIYLAGRRFLSLHPRQSKEYSITDLRGGKVLYMNFSTIKPEQSELQVPQDGFGIRIEIRDRQLAEFVWRRLQQEVKQELAKTAEVLAALETDHVADTHKSDVVNLSPGEWERIKRAFYRRNN